MSVAGSVAFLSLATSALRKETKKTISQSPPRPDGLSRVCSTPSSVPSMNNMSFSTNSNSNSSFPPPELSRTFSDPTYHTTSVSSPIPIPRSSQPVRGASIDSAFSYGSSQDGEGSGSSKPRRTYYFDNPRFLPH